MKQQLIPGLLLAGTLFFGYLYLAGPVPAKKRANASRELGKGQVSYSRVQNIKEQTRIRVNLKKQKAEMDQYDKKDMLAPEPAKRSQLQQAEINRHIGPAEQDLSRRKRLGAVSLDQKMDEFLAKKQEYEDLAQAKKELYVQAFIEEAYNMGYKVTINNNFEIVSVQRIDSQ